jgi:hypothetical protein
VSELVATATATVDRALEIAYDNGTATAKGRFATERVASVIPLTAREHADLSDRKMRALIGSIVDHVTDGWQHAVNAVHIVIAEDLAPRFEVNQHPCPVRCSKQVLRPIVALDEALTGMRADCRRRRPAVV